VRALRWLVPSLLVVLGCGAREETPPAAGGSSAVPGTGAPVAAGSTIRFHYTIKADGEVQMSTEGQEPATYVLGSGGLLPPLEAAIAGMKAGEKKTVTLKPEQAFGPRDSTATQRVPKSAIPNADQLAAGQVLNMSSQGQRFPAMVVEVGADDVLLDMNHPLAGKTVTFDVEIVSVQ